MAKEIETISNGFTDEYMESYCHYKMQKHI